MLKALLSCTSLNKSDLHILKRVYNAASDIYLKKIGYKTEYDESDTDTYADGSR